MREIKIVIFTVAVFILMGKNYLFASGIEILGEGAIYYHQENRDGEIRNPIGGLDAEGIKKLHGYIYPVFKYTYGNYIYTEVGLRLENPDFLKISESGSIFNEDYSKASILHPPHLFLEKLKFSYNFFNKIESGIGMWNYKELFFTPYTLHKWWHKSFFLDINYGLINVRGIHGANFNPYVTIADKVSLMLPIRRSDFSAVNVSYRFNKINEIGTTFVKQGAGKGDIVSINLKYVNNSFLGVEGEVAKEDENIATYLDVNKSVKNIGFKGEFFSVAKDYDASEGVEDKDFPYSWFPDSFSAGRVTFVDLNKNHEPDYPFDYNMERISYIGIYKNDVDPIVGDDINHNGVIDSVENDKYPEYKYKPDRHGFILTTIFGSTNINSRYSPNKKKHLYINYKVRIKSQISHNGSEQAFENFLNFFLSPIDKFSIYTKIGFSALKDDIADDTYYYNDYNLDGDLSEIEKKDWGMILKDSQNFVAFNNRLCNFDPTVLQNDYLGNFSAILRVNKLKGINVDLRGENLIDYDKESQKKYNRLKMRGKVDYSIKILKYFTIIPKYQVTYINDDLFYYQRDKRGSISTATNIITDGVTTNYVYVNTPDDEYLRSNYSEQKRWSTYLNSAGIRFEYNTFFIDRIKLVAEINYDAGKYYNGMEYVVGGRIGKLQSPMNIDFIFYHKEINFKNTGEAASYSKIMVGLSRWINPY